MDDRNMETRRTIMNDRFMSARPFPDEYHGQFSSRPSSYSHDRPAGLSLRETERDPLRYLHLPGKTVGYKRVWMQDNPWPEMVFKGSGSKRVGGQDHQYRTKSRKVEENTRIFPGGNPNDPLNLASCNDAGWQSPALEPDLVGPDRPIRAFFSPVNNFILDHFDPLGLQHLDMPFPPRINQFRTKRKRTRKKKDVGMDTAAATHSQFHTDAELEDKTTDVIMGTVDKTKVDVCSGKNGTEDISDSKTGSTEVLHSTVNTASATYGNESQSVNTLSTSKSCMDQVDETASQHQRSSASDNTGHPVDDHGDDSHNQQGTKENEKQELSSQTGPFSPIKSQSAGQQQSKLCGSEKINWKWKLEDNLQNKQYKSSYSHALLTSTDRSDGEQLPKTKKALRKALKIEPLTPREVEEVIREREIRDREWRRKWRHPRFKSPERIEEVTDQQLKQTLRFETKSAKPLGSEDFHLRKRRRTVSECDGYSGAKRLNFRRSSSPDVRSSNAPPRKMRHLDRKSKLKVSDQEQHQSTVKFAKNAAYRYGNYYRYYGYRTPDMAPDFRLECLCKDWFEGKDVLDIGCNAGDFTLAVAQLFHPQKIVGMDIDPNLVRIARQNIRSHQTKDTMFQMERYPVSTNEYGPIEPLPAITNRSNIFPKNVMFMQGNYVLKSEDQLSYVKEEYDTILALSVTKWIHLNYGDEGLKRAFFRMFQQLRPGGHLILEPQPWASYRRRKKLTPTFYKNYNSIKLKPKMFHDYLVDTVGFCSWKFLGQPLNPSKGFQRPMFLFTKYKDESPSKFESPARDICRCECPKHEDCSENPYSISQRIAQLAGYASNPDLGSFGSDGVQQDVEMGSQYETSSLMEAESSSSAPSSPSQCFSVSRTSIDSATSSLFHDTVVAHPGPSSEQMPFVNPYGGVEEGDVELVGNDFNGLEPMHMVAEEEDGGVVNGITDSVCHDDANDEAAVEQVYFDESYSAEHVAHSSDMAEPLMYNIDSPDTGEAADSLHDGQSRDAADGVDDDGQSPGAADGVDDNAQSPETIDVLPQQQSTSVPGYWLSPEADQLLPVQEEASPSEETEAQGEGYSSPTNQRSFISQVDDLNSPQDTDWLQPADPQLLLQGSSPEEGSPSPVSEVQEASAQDSSSSVEIDNSSCLSEHVQQTNSPLQHPEVSSSYVGLEMPLHQHDASASPEIDRIYPQNYPFPQQEDPSPQQEDPQDVPLHQQEDRSPQQGDPSL